MLAEAHPHLQYNSYEDYLNSWYRWTNSWFVCNAFCKTFLLLDSVVFTAHLALNIGPLKVWARGNIMMMSYSYYTLYMSIFCAMLLTGQPGYMMAPKSTRMTIFILSMMTVTFFNLNLLNMFLKYWNGVDNSSSMITIVQMYMLLE